MDGRLTTDNKVNNLVEMIKNRFDLELDTSCHEHLKTVMEHYKERRELLLRRLGESDALKSEEYAKAVLLSETARFTLLREIAPKRLKKKYRKDN